MTSEFLIVRTDKPVKPDQETPQVQVTIERFGVPGKLKDPKIEPEKWYVLRQYILHGPGSNAGGVHDPIQVFKGQRVIIEELEAVKK